MIRTFTEKISDTARLIQEKSVEMLSSGVSLFKDSLGRLPLFAGTRIYELDCAEPADETHYFLIPWRMCKEGFAVQTLRSVPRGAGPENSLPKRRVFHLPNLSAREKLEQLLAAGLSKAAYEALPEGSEMADRLERLADEIDAKSGLVAGGLVLIGGVVAVANPLLGVGIAAKALLPTVGSAAGRSATEYVADKLRERADSNRQKDARSQAEKSVKGIKPELFENPLLKLLERAVFIDDEDHDPALEPESLEAGLAWMRVRGLTAAAIRSCYDGLLDDRESCLAANLHPADVQWLRSLR